MKIFVSWSGGKARRVAKALKAFLQDVNQQLMPWFSDTDISGGQRWGLELANQLETTNYGIVCVTQESIRNALAAGENFIERGVLGHISER